MIKTEPKVFIIGETKLIPEGLSDYLNYIDVPDWKTDAKSDSEELIEFFGRLCYRSFDPKLNPNVNKVREGNSKYIDNIVEHRHGSVLEHATVNFVFADVSRVFTHELVRHRSGVAISQESLRYVRLDKLKAWPPTVISENEKAMEIFVNTIEQLEEMQQLLSKIYELDKPDVDFHLKKTVTSAMRRIAPIGLSTTIGWSANFRTLRWVLENRTHPSAEEEIRIVFGKVGEILRERYPNVFADFEIEEVDGHPHYKPKWGKI